MISLTIKYALQKKLGFLHKIGNTFYFLFNDSEESSKELKQLLKAHEFIEIKMSKENFRNFFIKIKLF